MFEDLKARSGMSVKEKTRLFVTLAGILVLGSIVFSRGGCAVPDRPLPAVAPEDLPPPRHLDASRFDGIRATGGDPANLDAEALDYVLGEVLAGALAREPERVFASPAEVAALDPKEWTGRLVEVVGTVNLLDREVYAARGASVDQLWSFELVGDDGSKVAVVHGGLSSEPEGRRPADAYHPGMAPRPIDDAFRVRVRGYYLQKFRGPMGRVSPDEPTVVLVGREYRFTVTAPPPIPGPDKASWELLRDRTLGDTRRVDDEVHYQLLAWAAARGHGPILADLRSGALPSEPWDQDTFMRWRSDLEADKDVSQPDPRAWTLAHRGRVFVTTGLLGEYLKEDWDSVGPNDYDVTRRWKYWLVSDFYANQLILLDSAFPIESFEGVEPPTLGRRPGVFVHAIYVRNYSYVPRARSGLPEGKAEITVPYFVLLHAEPKPPLRGTPVLQNPFFWAWVSLAVFGVAFFLVMSRLERKEAAMVRERQQRLRAGSRRAAQGPRAPGAGAPPPASP